MRNKKHTILLIVLIILLFIINYKIIDNFLIKEFGGEEFAEVERVIDGDTVVVNGSSVRLLGINSPERGEYLYEKAKEFLENLTLNKSLGIQRNGKDLYNRELVYLFDGNKNLNLEIVENGFGNYYFPEGEKKYYNEFVSAWEKCLNSNKNLCEKSLDKCINCIFLKRWDIKEDRVILENICDFNCDLTGWSIKDEGRKKFVFGNIVLKSRGEIEITNEDFEKDYVWTSSGDTLFLRDSEGKLILWESY